jgi:hypothetical protein
MRGPPDPLYFLTSYIFQPVRPPFIWENQPLPKAGVHNGMEPNLERWQHLCALAAAEEDPDKLLLLIREINDTLEAEEEQLRKLRKAEGDTAGN